MGILCPAVLLFSPIMLSLLSRSSPSFRWTGTTLLNRSAPALSLRKLHVSETHLDQSVASTPSTPHLLTESIHGRRRNYFPADHSSVDSKLRWEWIKDTHGITQSRWSWAEAPIQRVFSWLGAMFLPVGYPQSVHPVYARVHFWQFLETFVGSTVFVLPLPVNYYQ